MQYYFISRHLYLCHILLCWCFDSKGEISRNTKQKHWNTPLENLRSVKDLWQWEARNGLGNNGSEQSDEDYNHRGKTQYLIQQISISISIFFMHWLQYNGDTFFASYDYITSLSEGRKGSKVEKTGQKNEQGLGNLSCRHFLGYLVQVSPVIPKDQIPQAG